MKKENLSKPRSGNTKKRTRIQKEKEIKILDAALDVFSKYGFRGATIDQIADMSGMSKPNLLYYFKNKNSIMTVLIDRLLDVWLTPLRQIDPKGDPLMELQTYIHRKIEMSRDFPKESRLFANEVLQGAPRINDELADLKELVDEKAEIILSWIKDGRLVECDPYHLIFSIWATTQHYADFDAQVITMLGPQKDHTTRFEDAKKFLDLLFIDSLNPKFKAKI